MIGKNASKIHALIRLVIVYLVSRLFGEKYRKKSIWIISEKQSEARDNGYHFFKYMRTQHPCIDVYYIISKDSTDLDKITQYGNIVFANTWRHYFYFLNARYLVSSQIGGTSPKPSSVFFRMKKLRCNKQYEVFLQHGILEKRLGNSFNYNVTKLSLFTCSTEQERQFLHSCNGYPLTVVRKLGLCRFDNLDLQPDNTIKQILVMPTSRTWLKNESPETKATVEANQRFIESEYYRCFEGLLCDHRLKKLLEEKDYQLIFYPHFLMQPFIQCFDKAKSDRIIIADRWHFDVQTLLKESCVLITDYSSVHFDFSYMSKPVIYFQFDENDFYNKQYGKGYFDYRKDGFGPVYLDRESVITYLVSLMKNDCRMNNEYKKRVNSFFEYRDNQNCNRTYDAICDLGKDKA